MMIAVFDGPAKQKEEEEEEETGMWRWWCKRRVDIGLP